MRLCLLTFLPLLGLAATPPPHPRLYLTPSRIAQLREEINTFRKPHWEILRAQADSLVRRRAPNYEQQVAKGDPEQLWQREVGNAMPTLAMAWLMSGDPKYKAAAEEFALASCSYPTWGGPKYDGRDLSAGHQLFGLAMVYDWLYADLSAATREKIHDGLLQHGRILFAATDPKTGMYWRDEFMQNHLWVNATGLSAAALALAEEPETARWIEVTRDKFRRSDAALGPDGASHEGVGYWSYGVEYLLKFWALSADSFGEDLRSPWWRMTALYRLYLGLPLKSVGPRNAIVDIADCMRSDYYGPDYLLFNLAHRFGDGHAQWLAQRLEDAHATSESAPFLNLLWFDPKVKATPPDDLPALQHFEDLGIVSARTDWSGSESLVVFKSGPPAGHQEVQRGGAKDPGVGHVHPDANHFVIFGGGQWIIEDDGYRWKQTGQHNTLLLDGLGQTGEGAMWFRRKPVIPGQEARIVEVRSTPEYDIIAGDASAAYLPEAGLQRYLRRLVFWKAASAVLVFDDIQVDRVRDLELRFHPVQDAYESGKVRIDDLTPEGAEIAKGFVEGKDREGKPWPQYTVRVLRKSDRWQHVTAISWGSEPVKRVAEREFTSGSRRLTLPDR
jgi:hypothetical protein